MNAITSLKTFLADRVELFGAPLYASAGRLSVPADDPHDELAAGHGEDHDPADGQSFAIDYVDHAGNESHRRISVWAVQRNVEGVPILIAKCHERQATRAFRVDRITAITDLDGARREPLSRFFFETFGFVWPKNAIIVPPDEPADVRWDRIRTITRKTGVVLLAALALADGEMGAAEAEEVVFFCERACSAEGLDLTGAERERLAAYVGRLRPTTEAIDGALDTLFESGNEAIATVLKAGLRVVKADGSLRAEEAELLDTYCYALTGRHLL
ncbi:WYL domain-containing protein [Xanthobacter dioxanivorans]|uniref:WYL domain-containing protein n=1 Tax=Xanthobacter dioxanivorans TaxID=2528964 RepID=A0A974PT53_9HYPH|nr:WYL domain-containing protein [Xanthobacter dioxanivorans]QRG08793.1 WYL domain-containing protein [Xanthobacter dioxanivorans]